MHNLGSHWVRKFCGIFYKEWLLLARDPMGLITLFLLPMCLVVVMSLMQQNIGKPKGQLSLLMLNQQSTQSATKTTNKALNQALTKALRHNKFFTVTKTTHKAEAMNAVAKGEYRGLIIIQPSSSKAKPLALELMLDPAMPKQMQANLSLAMRYLLQRVELGFMQGQSRHRHRSKNMLSLDIQQISQNKQRITPTVEQQNVPAWTLFGMFFIVIPLAVQMVRERNEGVEQRLQLAPVSASQLLMGRSLAFVMLNLIQLACMLAVGIWLFPWLGLSSLQIKGNGFAIFMVGLCASLAAIGFGLLVGTLARTQHQVTTTAPFIIVMTAAISGIFVPTYLMPDALTYVSDFSPLYWAQSSFLSLFVRQESLADILPNLLKLLGFFVVMTLAALVLKPRRG